MKLVKKRKEEIATSLASLKEQEQKMRMIGKVRRILS